jgi:hypothetical protein
MTSIQSSVEKSSPALMSPGRPTFLALPSIEHKHLVDFIYASAEGSASKIHGESEIENDRLIDNTEVDSGYENLPTAELLVGDAMTNRKIANQTHRIEDSRITSRDEQTDKNVQFKDVLPGGIPGNPRCSKMISFLKLIDHYSPVG